MQNPCLIRKIECLRMGMIIADRPQKIAPCLRQMEAKNEASGGDVEARPVEQPAAYIRLAQMGQVGQSRQPHCVDLHHAEILGSIGIAMHDPDTPTFNGLDRGQHPWRKMIRRRDENHAGHKRYHGRTMSSVA
jgi:hypothetical protein